MFGSIAFAMGQKGAGGSSGLVGLVPLVLMFVIFYFILIRPQQKQVKRHQEFIKNLKKGDRVVTTGGLHGSITGITDTVVTLDIADNVRVKVSRSAVAGLSKDQTSTQQQ
ncbi:MAG: preprotein translocase subunit YajC [Deltaproteobacteria bacterium]|nr:preprotein translocase subunit YajC [Deltaproteobacteria bacterium]